MSTETSTVSTETATAPAARTVGLTKIYGQGETRVVALDDLSIDLAAGEFTSIMGPSGSGKSTLCTARPLWTLPRPAICTSATSS